jgi:hypothetical protein
LCQKSISEKRRAERAFRAPWNRPPLEPAKIGA